MCFLYIIHIVKKNLFELFIGKLFALPLWVKQALYYKLFLNMQENYCERFVIKNAENLFALYNPVVRLKVRLNYGIEKAGLIQIYIIFYVFVLKDTVFWKFRLILFSLLKKSQNTLYSVWSKII